MGIGNRLTDETYQPKDNHGDMLSRYISVGVGKCPVKFTEDPIEYCESKEYLGLTLRPKQKEFVEDLYSVNEKGIPNYSEGVFIAGMRCLGLGTPILMYDGTLKPIEDITVGDKVMGPDSKPRNVLEVCSGKSELFEVTQSCAMTYIINDQHILTLKKAGSVSCGVEKEYNKMGKKNSYVRYSEYPYVINIPIKEYLAKSDKWKYFFRGYTAGFISFKEQSVSIDPYLLGTFLGDGDSNKPTITSMDKEILDYWENTANNYGLSCRIEYRALSKARRYHIVHKPGGVNTLRNEFKKFNLLDNKHIPQCYISNSKEVRLQVLAGLIDTDGYLHKHGYEICQVNTTLAFDIKRLADSLGYRTNIREKRTTCQVVGFVGKAWRLTIHGDVWEIPVKLERKKYVHNGKHTHKVNGLSSLKVKSLGVGKFAGIAVNKDSLYCLRDGTVVHNSGKSAVAGMIATFQTHKLLAFDDPAGQLGQLPLDRLTVQCIAASQEQAGETIYAKVESMVNGTYWWRKYVEWLQKRETATGGKGTGSLFAMFTNHVEFFEKNVGVLALHSNSSALAGKTSACCIFDELSRFDVAEGNIQQKSQKRTAQAVYNTSTRAATSLMPFSKVVTITSPMYEDDYGMQLLLKAGTFKGGAHSAVVEALRTKEPIKAGNLIGYHFTTFEVNPGYAADGSRILGGCSEDDDFFVSKKEQDPEAYRRDYLAIPPSAISPFIEYPERLLSCLKQETDPKVIFTNKIIEDTAELNGVMVTRRYIAKDILITRPDRMTKYYLCCDQGLSKDSFVVAMGHGEEFSKKEVDSSGVEREIKAYKIIVDFVEKWVPDKQNRLTVNFQNVEDTILALSKAFNITSVCYDTWNSASSIQALFSQGVYTERIGATLEMYEILKQMIYTSLIVMPDDSTLVKEIRQLNLIKNIRIDHPAGGCFTGETKVKTLDGKNWTMKELSDMGSDHEFWVYACTSTGDIVPAKAYNAHMTKRTKKLCKVELDNGEIINCTPDHLFMTRDGDYKEARKLITNESLEGLLDDFMYYNHKVKSIQIYTVLDSVPVYDITVPGYNNFALDSGVFVHNSKDSADATVRVAWKLYVAYIKDAYQGNYMLGKAQKFPTLRSVASQYDMLNQQQQSGMNPQTNVFGGNFGTYSYGQSSGIFDGTIVRPNVVPNIDGE